MRGGGPGARLSGVEPSVNRPIRASDIVCADSDLSLAAKGLFALVGLLGPDCSLTEISARTTDPPEFLAMVLNELQSAGYVTVVADHVTVTPPGRFGVGLSVAG